MKDNKPSPQLHLQFTKKHKRNSGTEGLSIGRDLIAEVGKKPNTDLDVFHITKEGRLALSSVQCYTDPELLCDFRLDGHAKQLSRSDFSGKKLSGLSEFELILALGSSGWVFQKQAGTSRNIAPYVPDGQKTWYYHNTTVKGGINYRYLAVLAVANDLFREGLHKIYHGQPVSYYDCLLQVNSSALNEVQPWQTKAFYSELIKNHSRTDKASKKRPRIKTVNDDEEGRVWRLALGISMLEFWLMADSSHHSITLVQIDVMYIHIMCMHSRFSHCGVLLSFEALLSL